MAEGPESHTLSDHLMMSEHPKEAMPVATPIAPEFHLVLFPFDGFSIGPRVLRCDRQSCNRSASVISARGFSAFGFLAFIALENTV